MLSAARLNLALFLARLPIGAFFAIAGYNKIFGMGVSEFVKSSTPIIPTWVPPDFAHAFLTALPFVELASGIFILIGLLVRTFSLIQSLLLISFIIAMHKGYVIAHIPGSQAEGMPFDVNYVFLGLTLCLTLLGAGEWHARRMFRRAPRREVIVEDEPLVATTTRGTPIV